MRQILKHSTARQQHSYMHLLRKHAASDLEAMLNQQCSRSEFSMLTATLRINRKVHPFLRLEKRRKVNRIKKVSEHPFVPYLYFQFWNPCTKDSLNHSIHPLTSNQDAMSTSPLPPVPRKSQDLPKLPYTLRSRKLSIAIQWTTLCVVTSILPIILYFAVKFGAHAEIDVGT